MNEETADKATPQKKERKTRKVSIEEMVAVLKEKAAAQKAVKEAQERYENASREVDTMIKRAAAGTVKKALIELTQMKLV